MLRVLVADDNEGMRMVLRKAVEKAGHQIVGEATGGLEAVEMVEQLRPQVIFLDIEMSDLDGIGTARQIIDIDPRIFIVFATAHEEFRKEAFEIYAYDYLVKPFEISRIASTLERIGAQIQGQELPALPKDITKDASKKSGKLLLRHKDGISLVDTKDIILIQRENRATVIYTSTEKHITSETLSEMEQRLPSGKFFRCHKSYIVNVDRITRIYPYGRWTYIVKLKGTEMDALMTQERYASLQEYFQ